MMRPWGSRGIFFCVVLSFGCGRVATPARTEAVPTPTYYETFRVGDPVTDQTAGTSGASSNLVGTWSEAGTDVEDVDFAENIARVALARGAKLFFAFGQCYSGGFLDELASLGGSQSVLTSARHNELASYGFEAPNGIDVDFTDAFITALADGQPSAERVAARTAELNPFGPNPDIRRGDETIGSEHPQYLAVGDGADLRVADHAHDGMAVLWAGMPNDRDGEQMTLMMDRLVAMGYARDRIWLMYGSGEAYEAHPVVRRHIVGKEEPAHLVAATRDQLVDLFATQFALENAQKPSFVFMYVGDHGGLNGMKIAKHNFQSDDALLFYGKESDKQPGVKIFGEGTRKIR